MKPKVFIAEPNPRYSTRDAARFGEVIHLCDHIDPFDVKQSTAKLLLALREQDFDPATDFICMTGYAITVAILYGAALSHYSKINLLMFHAATNSYVEVKAGEAGYVGA